jgi:alanine dehydrogenase
MTLHFTAQDVRAVVTDDVALAAARDVVQAEADGETLAIARVDMPTPSGFLRVMPGRFRGIGGMKTMSMTRGVGNRYLLTVYDLSDGNVLAMLDADEVTRLRTAATTTIAAEILLAGQSPTCLGLLGTGFEAAGHLRSLARRFPLEEVRVFSRDAERRARFAATMSDGLGIPVTPTDTPEQAVQGLGLVCLATKNADPVVDGDAFQADAVVLSIGSTRPDLRELDARAFERAAWVLVDSVPGVLAESGDVRTALAAGVLTEARIVSMPDAVSGPVFAQGEPGLKVFKSVGTALQDLALAAAIIGAASANGHGRELGELAVLKKSDGPPGSAVAEARRTESR